MHLIKYNYKNLNLPLLKAAIQKMALCINEFTGSDKLSRSDKGNKILRQIEVSFRSFTGNIHFPSLCDAIVDILKKENNSNDFSYGIFYTFPPLSIFLYFA